MAINHRYRRIILALLVLSVGTVCRAETLFYLSAGTFAPEEAERLHQHLSERGYPVYIEYGDQYEVRLGSFDAREKAEEAAEKLKNEEKIIAQLQEEEDLDQYQTVEPTESDRDVSQETFQSHNDPRVQKMLSLALDLFGHPYKYGGTSIGKGIDCSFFTQTIFKGLGVALPRTSGEQFHMGKEVEKAALKAGDLLFFQKTYYSKKRRGKKVKSVTRINHVGIYIGNGEFIHATTNTKRVTISRLDEAYFTKRFAGARRVLED